MVNPRFHCAHCLAAIDLDAVFFSNFEEPECPQCGADLEPEEALISPYKAAERVAEEKKLWDDAVRDGLIREVK